MSLLEIPSVPRGDFGPLGVKMIRHWKEIQGCLTPKGPRGSLHFQNCEDL